MEVFLQALVNGILLGGFYSLMGMGQNIIFGVMNIVNFCHGEMLMVGMYITYVLYTYFGVDPYVALPIVAVLMFGLGALIQSTLITPSLKTKSFTNLLFLTVGLGLLLTNGALVIFGSTYYKIITPYSQTYIPLGPVTIALPRLVSFLILIVVAIALFAFLKYSTTGKQIRAVSQNPIGAEVVGINVKKIYILTYGLGVALAVARQFFCETRTEFLRKNSPVLRSKSETRSLASTAPKMEGAAHVKGRVLAWGGAAFAAPPLAFCPWGSSYPSVASPASSAASWAATGSVYSDQP